MSEAVLTNPETNGAPIAKEEDEAEFEYEEVSEYEETESEDEVVDKEIERKNSNPGDEGGNESKLNGVEETKLEQTEEIEEEEKKVVSETRNGENGKEKRRRHKHRVVQENDGEAAETSEATETKRHHRKHKKSRNMERLVNKVEAFNKKESSKDDGYKGKRIHVRSKDPLKIAKQIEKSLNGKQSKGPKGRPPPPQQKISTICKVCGKEPYVVERVVAEKSWWHKNCFRCKECNKILNLDTYMSHEGVIYCKPHHKELFQPKVVKSDLVDMKPKNSNRTQEAIDRHKEQEKKMEVIVRENKPISLGDEVVKSTSTSEESKYQGLENLDVGSKFKMFEKSEERESTDRYGILEKLKRLQEGAELDELLAEIEEELPSPAPEEEEDPAVSGMTHVQRKTRKEDEDKLFSENRTERKELLAAERRQELKDLREKLMAGTRDAVLDQFDDLLNASANKVKKTKVEVKSENAKKFREMFNKGEVPEGSINSSDRGILEKEQELQHMRKVKRQEKEFFRKMEAGELDESDLKKEPKLLIQKFKDVNGEINEDIPELAPLSNRFSFFEHYEEKGEKKKKNFRMTPPREGGEEVTYEDGGQHQQTQERRRLSEAAMARRDCKARSVLNKFKEMETKAMSGENNDVRAADSEKPVMTDLGFLGRLPGVGERRPLKRFTPPRNIGSDPGSDYSTSSSDYSDSDDYSDSGSYTSSCTESESEEDETLQAIRNTERAKKLRAKFEEWEKSEDAKEQERQLFIQDENGSSLETATNLKARFEALQTRDAAEDSSEVKPKFMPKRFK